VSCVIDENMRSLIGVELRVGLKILKGKLGNG
jgi:hypothetical protein